MWSTCRVDHRCGWAGGGGRSLLPWRYCSCRAPRPSCSQGAITTDADVHERVVAAAGVEGVSVSAWKTEAARRALLVRDGLTAVAEWEAEHGELSDAELAAARRQVAAEAPAGVPRRLP